MGYMPTRPTGTRLEWCIGDGQDPANLTLALEQERFGGVDDQVAEGMEKRNRDLRLLSRVSGEHGKDGPVFLEAAAAIAGDGGRVPAGDVQADEPATEDSQLVTEERGERRA